MNLKRTFGIKKVMALTILFLLITLLSPAGLVFAAAPNTQYNQDKNLLFVEESGQEDINPQTGSVNLTETDLKLSGRGGLDLEIIRYYSSTIANLYNMGYKYETAYNSYITIKTLNTHIDKKYGLGCGWGMAFPSLEINYDKEDLRQMNLYMGNGAVYSILFDVPGNPTNIEYYAYQDFRIDRDSSYTQHPGGVISTYCMTKKDQQKYYFDEWGNLLAIFDPGKKNHILFFYDSHVHEAKISRIVDTCGREILFQYDPTGKKLQSISWEDRVIQYLHHDFSDDPQSPIPAADGKFSLSGLIDSVGRRKGYTYSLDRADFSFNFGMYDQTHSNFFANLIKVERHYSPSDQVYLCSTTYEYAGFTKYIYDGTMGYYKVVSRWDEGIDGKIYKRMDYTYHYEPYNPNPSTNQYETRIHYPNGTTEIFYYDMVDHLCRLRIKENASEGLHERIEKDFDAIKCPARRRLYKGYSPTPTSRHYYEYDQSGFGDLIWEQDEEDNLFQYKYHQTFHTMIEKSLTNIRVDGTTFPVLQRWVVDDQTGYILEERVYHQDGQDLRIISKTKNTYDEQYGNLKSQVDALGHEISMEYDPNFHAYPILIREEITVDGDTNSIQVIEEKKDYYSDGLERWSEDGNGNRTQYEYDKAGRLTKKTHPDGTFQTNTYDDTNDIVKQWDENGHRTDEYSNGLGMNIKSVDYGLTEDHATLKEYDDMGNLIQITDPEGGVKTMAYDGFNRLIATYYPDGGSQITIYHDRERARTVYDANGRSRRYEYDRLDRLIRVKEYNGNEEYTTLYTYDRLGKRLTMEDAIGEVWTYEYDDLGRKISVIYPNSLTDLFSYDDMDNLIRKEDREGHVILYEYDERTRLIKVIYQGAGDGGSDKVFVKYAYDKNDNRISMEDQGGTTTYEYDSRDCIIAIHRMLGSEGPFTTEYHYDGVGNCTGIKYPFTPLWIIYSYDDFNRLESMPGYASFQYIKTGHRSRIDFNNGLETNYERDARYRPVRITTDNNVLDLNYRFDFEGNVLRINQDLFYYDDLDRMVKAILCLQATGQGEQGSELVRILQSFGSRHGEDRWIEEADLNNDNMVDGIDLLLLSTNKKQEVRDETKVVHYDYDAVGNRLIKCEQGQQDNYVYGNESRLLEIVNDNGTTTFTYSLNGNLIRKGTPDKVFNFVYDYENRLVKVYQNDDPSQVLSEHIYDGDGQRIKKIELGRVSYYLYDSSGHVICDLNELSQERASYIYDESRLLAMRVGSSVFYYHLDHLDSIRAITNETGDKGFWRNYYPFGKKLNGENLLNLANIFGFTGKETDRATGLIWLGARFYDPELGRFITPDPAEGKDMAPQSLNRYVYAGNNPLKYIDPLGYDFFKKIGKAIKKVFNKGKEIVKKVVKGINRIKGKVSGIIGKIKEGISKITSTLDKIMPYIKKGTSILRTIAPFLPGPLGAAAFALAGVGEIITTGYDILKTPIQGVQDVLGNIQGALTGQMPFGKGIFGNLFGQSPINMPAFSTGFSLGLPSLGDLGGGILSSIKLF